MNDKEKENLKRIIKNYPVDSYYGNDGKILIYEQDMPSRTSRGKNTFNEMK